MIPLSNIVNVNDSVISSISNSISLQSNVLTENILISPDNPTIQFSSLKEVGSFFGIASDEYLFAETYFKSYTNTTNYPDTILFSRYVGSNGCYAYLVSDEIQSTTNLISNIKKLTSATLSFNINNNARDYTFTSSDFSDLENINSLITLLNSKESSNTTTECTFSFKDNRILVESINTPPANETSITIFSDTPFAKILGFNKDNIIAQGNVGGDATYNMNNITNANTNWISLTYATRLTTDDIANGYPITVELAEWVNTQNNKYVLLAWSDNSEDLNIDSTTNLANILVNAGLGSKINNQITFNSPITLIYGSNTNTYTTNKVGIYSALYGGIGASINYTEKNGKINFALKSQAGLLPNCTTQSNYNSLINQSYEIYGDFANSSSNFNVTYEGRVGGIFVWLDNLYDSVWITNQLQTQLANFLTSQKRVTYDLTGQVQIKSVITSVANQCLKNGVIEVGNTFSEEEKQEIIALVGSDISSQLSSSGYYVYFPTVTPSERQERKPLQIMFLYSNGGSVKSINLDNTFVM